MPRKKHIINCNLIPTSRFHLRDIFIASFLPLSLFKALSELKAAPPAGETQQRDHVCAIEYYWVDIGHNLYALVSHRRIKKVEILDSGDDESEMNISRKRNCHVHNESLKYELNRQVTRLELMKCNFDFCGRVPGRAGQIIA